MNRVFNQLLMWQKLALIGALALLMVAVPSWLYVQKANAEVDFVVNEHDGIASSHAFLEVVRLTQQHRGLSAVVLGGNLALADQRRAKSGEVAHAIAAMDALLKDRAGAEKLSSAWTAAVGNWKSLEAAVSSQSIQSSESFKRHTELIGDYFLLMESILDHFGLSLDPTEEGYFLIQATLVNLPAVTEMAGQARGKGAGMLAKREASPADRIAVAAAVDRIADDARTAQRNLDKAIDANSESKSALEAINRETQTLIQEAIKLAQDQVINADRLEYDSKAYFDTFTRAIDAQFKGIEVAVATLDKLLADREAATKATRNALAGLVVALSAFGTWLIWFVSRNLSRRMGTAVVLAKAVAAGDLTKEVEVDGADEAGQLLAALKEMNASLAQTVGQVRSSAEQVASSASQLSASANQVSEATQAQSEAASGTAAAVEEVTVSITMVAQNAEGVRDLAKSSLEKTEAGNANMQQLVAEIGHVEHAVTQITAAVDEFVKSSRAITDMTKQVKDIAEQTNLLALNAAIEAARAGEQGRGFAVVADEVRKLAEKSGQSANDIDAVTRALGEQSSQVEKEIRLGMESLSSSRRHVKAVVEILTQAKQAVASASVGVEDIAASVKEQTAASNDIARNVEKIALMAEENNGAVNATSKAATSLEQLASQLNSAVSGFKVA